MRVVVLSVARRCFTSRRIFYGHLLARLQVESGSLQPLATSIIRWNRLMEPQDWRLHLQAHHSTLEISTIADLRNVLAM